MCKLNSIRILSCFMVLLFIGSCFTITAFASQVSGWTELLEYTSVQPDGGNQFTVTGTSGSVTLGLETSTRLRKIDMLIWNPVGQRFSSAKVTADGTTNTLDIFAIGSNLTRVVGYVPNAAYHHLTVQFTKATNTVQTYELLSCKVTPIGVQEFVATAKVFFQDYGNADYYSTDYNIPMWCEPGLSSDASSWLARVQVSDWQKYDSLSIWGSATSASIESIRVSIGTTALDYKVNYIDPESAGYFVDGDPAYLATAEWGKYLFNITIDLTGVDRSLVTSMYVYFTGTHDLSVQGYFNCQYVNGSLTVADTSDLTWWNRFTRFMTGLFGGDTSAADEFQQDAEQQRDEFDQMNEQLEAVTKPPVEDVQTDIGAYVDPVANAQVTSAFQSFASNPLITTMMMITLTVALVGYILFGKR